MHFLSSAWWRLLARVQTKRQWPPIHLLPTILSVSIRNKYLNSRNCNPNLRSSAHPCLRLVLCTTWRLITSRIVLRSLVETDALLYILHLSSDWRLLTMAYIINQNWHARLIRQARRVVIVLVLSAGLFAHGRRIRGCFASLFAAQVSIPRLCLLEL